MCLNSLAMGVWGWWAFDIFTLIATYMDTAIIAAQTILRTLGLITFMLPVGIMSASGTLIGNSVGAGRADHAIIYNETSMKMGVALAIVQVLVLLLGKDLFVLLFTNQQAVGEQMILAWPVLMVFVIFDTTQGISSSVIRGTG
jgi:MATE family multidrug resistance protein